MRRGCAKNGGTAGAVIHWSHFRGRHRRAPEEILGAAAGSVPANPEGDPPAVGGRAPGRRGGRPKLQGRGAGRGPFGEGELHSWGGGRAAGAQTRWKTLEPRPHPDEGRLGGLRGRQSKKVNLYPAKRASRGALRDFYLSAPESSRPAPPDGGTGGSPLRETSVSRHGKPRPDSAPGGPGGFRGDLTERPPRGKRPVCIRSFRGGPDSNVLCSLERGTGGKAHARNPTGRGGPLAFGAHFGTGRSRRTQGTFKASLPPRFFPHAGAPRGMETSGAQFRKAPRTGGLPGGRPGEKLNPVVGGEAGARPRRFAPVGGGLSRRRGGLTRAGPARPRPQPRAPAARFGRHGGGGGTHWRARGPRISPGGGAGLSAEDAPGGVGRRHSGGGGGADGPNRAPADRGGAVPALVLGDRAGGGGLGTPRGGGPANELHMGFPGGRGSQVFWMNAAGGGRGRGGAGREAGGFFHGGGRSRGAGTGGDAIAVPGSGRGWAGGTTPDRGRPSFGPFSNGPN